MNKIVKPNLISNKGHKVWENKLSKESHTKFVPRKTMGFTIKLNTNSIRIFNEEGNYIDLDFPNDAGYKMIREFVQDSGCVVSTGSEESR